MGLIELATSPLPVVLAIFGGIAVLLAMIGSVEGNIVIKITPGRQRVLFAIGMVFIAAGLTLYVLPRAKFAEPLPSPNSSTLTPIPTETPDPVPATPAVADTPEVTPGHMITDTPQIPPAVPEILVLFEDDFGSGLLPEWQWDRNSWRVQNQRATSISCGVISVGSPDWNNYVLSFTFELPSSTDGNVQVLFAVHDQQSSWVAALLTEGENGAVSLLKRTESGVTWPSGVTTQRSGLFQAKQASQFALQVDGSRVRLSINDQEAYDVDLGDNLSGAIGLRSCPKSLSWIDDVKIVLLPE